MVATPGSRGVRHIAASREADERAAARRRLPDLARVDEPDQRPAGNVMERDTTLARLRSVAAQRLILVQHRRDHDGVCVLCRVRRCDPWREAHRVLTVRGESPPPEDALR